MKPVATNPTHMLDKYESLSSLQKKTVDFLTLIFSGLYTYNTASVFKSLFEPSLKPHEIDKLLNELQKSKIITIEAYHYNVDIDLKIALFPKLLQERDNITLAKKIRTTDTSERWSRPISLFLRDYLYMTFLGSDNGNSGEETEIRIINRNGSLYGYTSRMIANPAYDRALIKSERVLQSLWNELFYINKFNFCNMSAMRHFIQRIPGKYEFMNVTAADMDFLQGNTVDSQKKIQETYNCNSLIIASQIALYSGQYERAITCFETARVTDEQGLKVSKNDFSVDDEYFYWLNFLFFPSALNIKKTDAFINKSLKDKERYYRALLPLLYTIKKDHETAADLLQQANLMQWENMGATNIYSLLMLLNLYIVNDELSELQANIAEKLCHKLKSNEQWPYLSELLYILKDSGYDIGNDISLPSNIKLPPPLMSRLVRQEKWEQSLDGLLNLFQASATGPKEKDETTSRLAYLLDIERKHIQPILQTRSTKGWSAGRNIAIKRFKEQMADGMTEQDRKIAKSVVHNSSSYYGSNDYYINFDRTLPELCGHPLLFLISNPSVSVELVKAQPELATEETPKGIKLKTNLPDGDSSIYVVKETQTRYKVVALTTAQQKAVRMIHQGIFVPKQGKEKLLLTMTHLSGIMTVQTDMADATDASKTIAADSRVRVQILPIGDGLKAEMFVKPLGTVPPYAKPGKGGKVLYGTLDGEKCQAVRDFKAEKANAELVSNDLAQRIDADLILDAVMFNTPHECLELLEAIGRHTDVAVVEWPEGERFRIKRSVSFDSLRLSIKGKGQWFELEGELQIDEQTVLAIKELLALTQKQKGRFLELNKNEFLAISEDLRKQLDELEAVSTISKDSIRINTFAAHAIDDIANQAGTFKTDKSWKEFRKKIKEIDKMEPTVPSTLEAELRPYQEEGFRWMTRIHAWGAGACLADDMGLGKTLQAIAMMLHLAENGPSLVVCPASVVPNWCTELNKFAPTLNPVVLKNTNREEAFAALAPFDVLVLTYGLLQTEEARITDRQWAMVVLDEAHAIKNTQTKSSKAAMNIGAGFKIALTGTPIQNHLGELWNLFNFCNPGLLGTLQAFTDRYVKNDDKDQKIHLKKLISPFILRRTKNKVLDELPPKTEITHTVELSDAEMSFYEALRQQAIDTIENGDGGNGQQHLLALAEITKLRLACCNTALANKEIQLPSSKLAAFFEIIDELRENKHRALVFSQFVGHLAIVKKALDKQGIAYQYLDGSTPIAERQAAVKAFQSGKGDLFLISLKAGGLGLNLTAADYVLHLDPWWNPAIEDQASDRAHRMGQTRPVTIYRLVAKNTIEEKIVQLHANKRNLADNLLDGTDQSAKLSTADLLELLKEK